MLNREHIRVAVQNSLVCVASYLAGFYFTNCFHGESSQIGALWSMVSGIVVLQATTRETWKSATLRVLGTMIGAIIAGLYLCVLPFSPLGMAVCVGVAVLVCQIVGVPENGRLAAITVAIIMVISNSSPASNPFANAALRFVESCIGATIAVLLILLWPKGPDAAA